MKRAGRRADLFTGLLRFTRNDSRSRISVIASKRNDAWQSSLFYVARSAQNFYRGAASAETDEFYSLLSKKVAIGRRFLCAVAIDCLSDFVQCRIAWQCWFKPYVCSARTYAAALWPIQAGVRANWYDWQF